MKLVVGLGNPGREYVGTRHNIGFNLLDYIASRKKLEFKNEKFNGVFTSMNVGDEKIILLKPLSYMNLSGGVVKTVGSSILIDEFAKKLGIEVIETAVGFKHIGNAMLKATRNKNHNW